jgi:hypothetical protein
MARELERYGWREHRDRALRFARHSRSKNGVASLAYEAGHDSDRGDAIDYPN